MGVPQMASPLGLPWVGEDVWILLTLAPDVDGVPKYGNILSLLCMCL